MTWNWQQPDWPNFSFDSKNLKEKEGIFLHRAGQLEGASLHFSDPESFLIDCLSEEAVQSSAIEGDILHRESVQSSIRKHLGLAFEGKNVSKAEDGMARMRVDLYRTFDDKLTHELLWRWNSMILIGRQDLEKIGEYRTHEDPMQIVSNSLGGTKVHFEAPPSRQVPHEMEQFIEWFNASSPNGDKTLSALTRASIAHLYFETIHPFEDGNGRIGRALVEKVLAQALKKPVFFGLSKTIMHGRKRYYEMLELSSRTNIIQTWIEYFADQILISQLDTFKLMQFVIFKSQFWTKFGSLLNQRQQKVIQRIFKEGVRGFEGGLSAANYLSITGTSRATATRDLNELVKIGALEKKGTGKHTRYFLKQGE